MTLIRAEQIGSQEHLQLFRLALRARLEEPSSPMAEWRTPEPGSTELRSEHGAGLLRALHDEDWNRHGWPEDVGGVGGDVRYRAILYDELSRAGFPSPEQNVILETVGPPVVRFAPELAAKYLPGCLRGEEVWCQGFSEPEAGSDLASLRCRATAEGDDFVVNGQKTWTTLGHLADRMALLCRTGAADSRHRGLSMLLVDMRSPGVTVRPIALANGLNEVSEVFFTDVRVPRQRLIGEVDGGWAVAMHLLQFERGMYAWMRQAVLLGLLCQLVGHVRVREDSAARRALGNAHLAITVLRAKSGATVERLARDEDVGPGASADKILLAQAEQTLLDAARELLGGELELGEGAFPDHWRAAWFYTRASSIYGGSAEIQRSIIADRVLGLPKERS